MTPERWQQVKGVLEKVLERAPSERAVFLVQACDGDQALRREVESLLASDEQGRSSFLQSPTSLRLVRGARLGDYEIQSLIGAGGMGEVYRARDLRLRRDVAIKVLPAFVASDPDRLRRFEQEATAAAALNHPNILAVYQMGTNDGAPYLVSELLEGETLREQMKRGPMAARRAMDYGIQITRGLAVAHEKGIVHRDLKPENLFVTKDGRVKILDFGLAKLTRPQHGSEHSAPTLGAETEAGAVMGTVGYMAPEQVRGQAADQRADIFAFGAVLYEMLAGKRAFQKPTSPETMTAILNEDPPGISQVVPNLPPALQRVVHRCLEKNPEQRFQSTSDLAFALEALSDTGASVASRMGARRKAIVPAAFAVLALSVGSYFYFHRTSKLTDKDTIALADFTNTTGDPVFDETPRQGLSVQLEQSPFLSLVSEEQIQQTLRMMGQPSDARVTPEIGLEICQRTGSAVVLDGSIAQIGTQYNLILKAVNCSSGESLASAEARASDKNHVLDALGKAANEMRGKLGESLSTVQKFDTPLEQATTPSLEALHAFTLGDQSLVREGDNAGAVPFLQRAVQIDPNFAFAHIVLGFAYSNLGESRLAAASVRKGFELRERSSEWERLEIEIAYNDVVTGDLDKARKVANSLLRPIHASGRHMTFWQAFGTISDSMIKA